MLTRYGGKRLNPTMVGEEARFDWSTMGTFERLCWDWSYVTERLLEAADADANATLVRFEDILLAKDSEQGMARALRHLTDFGDHRYRVRIAPEILTRRINPSTEGAAPEWADWPKAWREYLLRVCGHGMARLGYEQT